MDISPLRWSCSIEGPATRQSNGAVVEQSQTVSTSKSAHADPSGAHRAPVPAAARRTDRDGAGRRGGDRHRRPCGAGRWHPADRTRGLQLDGTPVPASTLVVDGNLALNAVVRPSAHRPRRPASCWTSTSVASPAGSDYWVSTRPTIPTRTTQCSRNGRPRRTGCCSPRTGACCAAASSRRRPGTRGRDGGPTRRRSRPFRSTPRGLDAVHQLCRAARTRVSATGRQAEARNTAQLPALRPLHRLWTGVLARRTPGRPRAGGHPSPGGGPLPAQSAGLEPPGLTQSTDPEAGGR